MRTAGPVGFDLDLTLVNSRPAIMAAWQAVAEELGVSIDLDEVDRRMGIKLEDEVTAKHPVSVRPSLAAVSLEPDEIFAHVHGPEKAAVLARIGAAVYVGDTPADMTAGVVGGAVAVGVPTGSFGRSDLAVAGAEVVLESLADFPAWYAEFRDGPTEVSTAGEH